MLRFSCAAFALCAMVAVAAPLPKGAPPTLYHPTTVGTKWVYTTETTDSTEVISSVEVKNGENIVKVSVLDKNGKPSQATKLSVSERGIRRLALAKEDFPKPVTVLDLTAKTGVPLAFEIGGPGMPHERVGKRYLARRL